MGCSSSNRNFTNSNIPTTSNSKSRQTIDEQKRKYDQSHENFELLLLDADFSKTFFEGGTDVNFNSFFDAFYGKFLQKFSALKMTRDDVRDVILEKIVEGQMEDLMNYKEYDIFEVVLEIVDHIDELQERLDMLKAFALTSKRYFPDKQKCINLIGKKFKKVTQWGIKYIFSNLKFNSKFLLYALKVILSPMMFENDSNIFGICDVIKCSTRLYSVIILFQQTKTVLTQPEFKIPQEKIKSTEPESDYNPEDVNLLKVQYIFKAIQNHANINAFVLANYGNYLFKVPELTKIALYDLIASDKLFALCISKINLSYEDVKHIINLMGNLRNLKFFILEWNLMNKDILDMIIACLISNQKIFSCLLAGGTLEVDSLEIEARIQKSYSGFRFFHHVNELKMFNG